MGNQKQLIHIPVLAALLAITQAKHLYLFGANPNGGVWAGALETTGDGTIDMLDNTAYPSLGSRVEHMSYDKQSKQILMELNGPHSLVYGPACTNTKDLPHILTNLTREKIALTHEHWGDCVNCAVGAFTLHHGKIYFLLVGEYMSDMITRIVQVRVLENCEKCPDFSSQSLMGEKRLINLIKCSKEVSDVYYKAITLDMMDDIVLKPGKSMKIIKQNRVLTFYFNIANITDSEDSGTVIRMELYKANVKNERHLLHSEELDSRYADWDISALGSVDVRDDLICWTCADRMFCAEEKDNQLKENPDMMVMFPAEGVVQGICRGEKLDLLSVLSGISILEKSQESTIAFSCYPQEKDHGGVGLLRLKLKPLNKRFEPVKTSNGDRLLAGSLFFTNMVAQECSYEPQPEVCLPQAPTEVFIPSTTTPVPTKPPTTPRKKDENAIDQDDIPRDEGNADSNEIKSDPVVEKEDKQTVSGNSASSLFTAPYLVPLVLIVFTLLSTCRS